MAQLLFYYMMYTREIELLAPAGNPEMAYSVFRAGADAVYFGGENFSARAYADNFTKETAAKMLDFAHIHGKKAYLAVNTLLKNTEIEYKLFDELKFYYEQGVDAVLVCDFGVLNFCRTYFPELTLHASTQMNITSSYGAKYMKKLGLSRIVTARELSLEEISAIHHECDIEIESFAHGALCVCYSGQCLFSGYLGGRSGNRGRCAQPCRLPYELYEDEKRLAMDGDFLLSPKDFCTIEHLDKICNAGVSSLKLEGRKKSIGYASTVTSLYRHYLDRFLENGSNYKVDQKDIDKLMAAGNRQGFTNTYLFSRNSSDMMSFKDSSLTSTEVEWDSAPLRPVDINAYFYGHTDYEMSLTLSTDDASVTTTSEEKVLKAKKNPTDSASIEDKINKTSDLPFSFADITVDISDDAFIPLKYVNNLRRKALLQLSDEYLKQFHKKSTAEFMPLDFNGFKGESGDVETYIRISGVEQLKAVYSVGGDFTYIIPYGMYEEYLSVAKTGEPIIAVFPMIRGGDEIKEFMLSHKHLRYEVSSYDALELAVECGCDRIVLGERLYTMSERARMAFVEKGFSFTTVPGELSSKELAYRNNYNDKYQIYGRKELMYTVNCMTKNSSSCNHANNHYMLKDRKGTFFPVVCDCANCTNIIYNSKPTYLFHKLDELSSLGIHRFELSFTVESEKEIREILKKYESALKHGDSGSLPDWATTGHYRKGVI